MSIYVPVLPADPVLAAQSAFRAVMNAMARPGSIQKVDAAGEAPGAMTRTTAAVARTLFDQDTAIWLDGAFAATSEVSDWLRFHTGAKMTSAPEEAAFALIAHPEQSPPFGGFNLGTPEYPDRSTTIIMQVRSLAEGMPLVLAGPGIKGATRFAVSPVPLDFMSQLAMNRGLFPRGIDLILVADGAVAALPRSVRITIERG